MVVVPGVAIRLTMQSDHAEDEDQRQNQDDHGVDLETGGLVRVQPCSRRVLSASNPGHLVAVFNTQPSCLPIADCALATAQRPSSALLMHKPLPLRVAEASTGPAQLPLHVSFRPLSPPLPIRENRKDETYSAWYCCSRRRLQRACCSASHWQSSPSGRPRPGGG